MLAYRIPNEGEVIDGEIIEEYDSGYLVGPNKFVCYLGEPEDCCWIRDGNKAMVQLNKIHELLAEGYRMYLHKVETSQDWMKKVEEILGYKTKQ